MPRRLLIIGGVAGGTSAAGRARRTDPELEIILFEKGDFVSYGACDEPYYIAGEVPDWKNLLVRSPEAFKKKQNIDVRLRCEVVRIDPAAKKIAVLNRDSGVEEEHAYDALVIATGARPRELRVPGAEAPNVFSLKSLESARAIHDFIVERKPRTAVTYGGGFIALEMAEAFAARGIKNTIVHRSGRLGGDLEPEIRELVAAQLAESGVEYIPDARLEKLETGPGGECVGVVTDKGIIEADFALVATGVVVNAEIAVAAGVELGPTGAIAVDERQRTNLADVYAAGDCCESTHRIGGHKIFTPLGDVANKQGWTAGENAAGGEAAYPGSLGSWMLKTFDLQVGATGVTESKAQELGFDAFSTVVDHASRAHAQPKRQPIRVKLVVERKTGRLLGGQIAGREGAAQRVNSLAVAVAAEMTVGRLSETDFGYCPPFSPVIDPILMAARVATKKLGK